MVNKHKIAQLYTIVLSILRPLYCALLHALFARGYLYQYIVYVPLPSAYQFKSIIIVYDHIECQAHPQSKQFILAEHIFNKLSISYVHEWDGGDILYQLVEGEI